MQKNILIKNLTSEEQEVFDLLIENFSAKEIAAKLNKSHHTVDYHRRKLYRKLGVHSINELTEKYNNAQPENMIVVSNQPSQNILQRVWQFPENRKSKRFLFITASILLIIVSILSIRLFLPDNTDPKLPYQWYILSRHGGWRTKINAANQEIISGSSASFQIGREIINKRQKYVLTLHSYLIEYPDWKVADFYTQNNFIINLLKEGSGLRFKVLADAGMGWQVTLWTNHERLLGLDDHVCWDYPLFTVENQIVDFDIPLADFIQPTHQVQFPFDENMIHSLVIQRNSQDTAISGYSTIKIFDFEIY
ncbi:MAG: helix-turn-helix transcriptional regulator [Treponema sp.]|nr:helix-turn-helix transcriptional regulator [Treponema sp.]